MEFTFWIQMRKNKPLDESRKRSQTSGTKMAFYSLNYFHVMVFNMRDYVFSTCVIMVFQHA
ncbi:hypothetical protein Hanom_Chr00s002063g01690941 [Helianthus anomalus]